MNFRAGAPAAPDVPLTPLIDVVFLLLLFFILTTSFRDLDFLDLQLVAQTRPGETDAQPCLRLALDAEGAAYLDRARLPPAADARAAQLRRAFAGAPDVCVHAHALTPHGAVVAMMAQARAAGADAVRLGTLGEQLP